MVAWDLDLEPVSLDDIIRPPAWMRDAACIERPDVEFFIELGGDDTPARAVCAGCLVRVECLEYALERHIRHGMWGGTSDGQRRRARAGRLDAVGLLAELESAPKATVRRYKFAS